MPKGYSPKPSQDPDEPRMMTWRYCGAIHNRLIRVAAATRKSLNYYVTCAILKQIEKDETDISQTLTVPDSQREVQ